VPHPEPNVPSRGLQFARPALWIVALALVIFVCIWPLIAGMVAANDDLKFIRGEQYSGTFVEDLRDGWVQATNFRPLENIAALLCDAWTLESRRVMLIQIPGLLVLVAGAMRLLRRLLPESSAAPPLLIIWLMLSPATTVSMWQMDTCSQTWSAALGVWMGLLAWMTMDAARTGRPIWWRILALSVFTLIAINVKEMMYGWSFGVSVAIALTITASLVRAVRRAAAALDARVSAPAVRAAARSLWLLLPVVILPALHLLYRLKFAGLGRTAETATAQEDARYQATLGMNVLKNAWMSLLGIFGNGPLHLLRDDHAPIVLQLLPLASMVCVFIALAAAGAIALVHHGNAADRPSHCGAIVLCVIAGVLSVSVTLPMGSVSELYGMGANLVSGLLLIVALARLWNPPRFDERTMCRSIAIFCAAVIFIVGVYGVASRAYHFRLTWLYAREFNHALIEHQRAVEPSPQPFLVLMDRSCNIPPVHNQYVIPPLLAVGVDETRDWMKRIDPQRAPEFRMALSRPGPRDLIVPCDSWPPRQHR
jgi:hypothetical protein